MANASIHKPVAAASGTIFAAVRARAANQPSATVLFEGLGGCIGGLAGGCLPDWVEPATWPGHRSFFHSLLLGGVATTTALQSLNRWESFCRQQAEIALAKSRAADASDWQRFCDWIVGLFWQIAAGFLAGLIAGYGSHLALDLVTPAGLPLIVGLPFPRAE
jgi:hypothetical protein